MGAEFGGGRNHDIANGLGTRVAVDQTGPCEDVQEFGMRRGAHTANLHIGAVAKIEIAIAETPSGASKGFEL